MALSFNKEEFITCDRYLNIALSAPHSIKYIKTDALYTNRPIRWRGASHTFTPAHCWITGHSDNPITRDIYDRYNRSNTVWFAVNAVHSGPTIYPLPLGLTNDCSDTPVHPIYGNLDIMLEVMGDVNIPAASRPVYMNFQKWTCPSVRERVWNLFKDKDWVTVGSHTSTLEGRKEFLRDIRAHKFVLCPRGNGVDTVRLWETLYMGSIPIVVRDPALRDFTDLPIAWINDWTEVTPEWLDAEYARIKATAPSFPHEKLCLSYWRNKILAATAPAAQSLSTATSF